jgi:hypothetical protein
MDKIKNKGESRTRKRMRARRGSEDKSRINTDSFVCEFYNSSLPSWSGRVMFASLSP